MNKAANQQLFDAASGGDLEAVKAALEQGADLKAKDAVDMTALTIAARDGHVGIVMYLLEQGAEVTNDTIQVAGMSAYSNLYIVKLLQLAQLRQVKPETKHHSETDTQLLRAAHTGSLDSLKKAIQAGANINVSDDQDTSALRWAARGGHLDAVKALLDAGADVNQKSYSGWTALMEVVLAGSEEIVSLLIERGADVNIKTFASASALYFARDVVQFSPNPEAAHRIINLLEEHGAEYSAPEQDDD